jgi:hypothetical protein
MHPGADPIVGSTVAWDRAGIAAPRHAQLAVPPLAADSDPSDSGQP